MNRSPLSAAQSRLLDRVLDTAYSAGVVLDLAYRAEQQAGQLTSDPASAHNLRGYARRLRDAVDERKAADDLVSLRRDWHRRSWIEWLRIEAPSCGMYLLSDYEAALGRAGCPDPAWIAESYATDCGAEVHERRPHEVPTDWVAFVNRNADGALKYATGARDVAGWIVERGWTITYPTDPIVKGVTEWLRTPTVWSSLAPAVRAHVPVRLGPDLAEEMAPTLPAPPTVAPCAPEHAPEACTGSAVPGALLPTTDEERLSP